MLKALKPCLPLKFAAGYMKAEAPEKYHDILVPDFRMYPVN
jgi:hypothetical protein